MTTLTIIDRNGQTHSAETQPGFSLMEIIRDAGLDELLALCGGCCSCATCHVFVDEEHFDRLGPLLDDEDDLLDSSSHRRATSRLSCQIDMSDVDFDLRITIAPED